MVAHKKEVYYRLGIWHSHHITHKTNTRHQVTTAMDGHLPSLAGLPTNPRMVTHQSKDSHPQEGSVIQTCNLALYSQNERQVTTAMDGHLPSLGGSPTNPRMVSHQPKDGQPPTQGWSPTRRKCTKDLEFGTYTLLKMRQLPD